MGTRDRGPRSLHVSIPGSEPGRRAGGHLVLITPLPPGISALSEGCAGCLDSHPLFPPTPAAPDDPLEGRALCCQLSPPPGVWKVRCSPLPQLSPQRQAGSSGPWQAGAQRVRQRRLSNMAFPGARPLPLPSQPPPQVAAWAPVVALKPDAPGFRSTSRSPCAEQVPHLLAGQSSAVGSREWPPPS